MSLTDSTTDESTKTELDDQTDTSTRTELDDQTDASTRTELDDQTDASTRTELDDRIRCARCRAEITTGSLAVKRGGAHEHTRRNPAGYSWTIGCFRDAAGCTSEGAFTAEATWFAGYEWCFAPCATCGRHLGWWFTGSGPSFVGLIVSRLSR